MTPYLSNRNLRPRLENILGNYDQFDYLETVNNGADVVKVNLYPLDSVNVKWKKTELIEVILSAVGNRDNFTMLINEELDKGAVKPAIGVEPIAELVVRVPLYINHN